MEKDIVSAIGNMGYIILAIFIWLIYLGIIALYIISMWKIFVKAGRPGWAAIIPIYSTLILLEILGQPWWFLLLMIFIPFASLVIGIILMFEMAKVFGKSVGFGFGLLFLSFIFIPILAFSNSSYTGYNATE